MQTLHVYPADRNCHDSESVAILPVDPGQSEYEAALQWGVDLVKRDSAFAAINSQRFRSRWADIVIHSVPLSL